MKSTRDDNKAHAILDTMADKAPGHVWLERDVVTATGLSQSTTHAWLMKLRDLELISWHSGNRSRGPETGWVLTELGISFHGILQRSGKVAA